MSLEDVLKQHERYNSISELTSQASQDTNLAFNLENYRNSYASFLGKYEKMGPAQASTVARGLLNNVDGLGSLLRSKQGEEESNLVEAVKKDYKQIIEKLSKEHLQEIATMLPGKDKKYLDYANVFRSQNPQKIRATAYGIYKFDGWTDIVDMVGADKMLASYIEDKKVDFFKKELAKEVITGKDKKGKDIIKHELDEEKTKKYILNSINAIEEDKRDSIYVSLAEAYVQTKAAKDKK